MRRHLERATATPRFAPPLSGCFRACICLLSAPAVEFGLKQKKMSRSWQSVLKETRYFPTGAMELSI